MAEKFCLKWNDFQANVTSSFRKLRQADDFYDVTLVSDDQKQVSAHKVVLSASSEYFKNILVANKHAHPLLCLSGINSAELNNILDYLYNGEIQIYQENLDNFLRIAQRFKLEGLLQGEEQNGLQEPEVPERLQMKSNEDIIDGRNDNQEFKNNSYVAKRDINIASSNIMRSRNEKVSTVVSTICDNIEELDEKIEEMIQRYEGEGGKYQCTTCGKVSSQKSNAKDHAELHFDGLSFPCSHCSKSFRSRRILRYHANNYCSINKKCIL